MGAKYRDPTFFVNPGFVEFPTRKQAEEYAEAKTIEAHGVQVFTVHAGSLNSRYSFVVTAFALSFGTLVKWSRKLPEAAEFINRELGRKEHINVIVLRN